MKNEMIHRIEQVIRQYNRMDERYKYSLELTNVFTDRYSHTEMTLICTDKKQDKDKKIDIGYWDNISNGYIPGERDMRKEFRRLEIEK